MHNKVTWKKGMRLSTEVFNAMDKANEESFRVLAHLGSANRYGLFPSAKPFELSVNINGNALEVTSLRCNGITKTGCFIDIDYDSNFVNSFDTRIAIPSSTEGEAFYLVVKVHEDNLREINETLSELSYSFELIGENSPLADNCLPIGMLVNQYGWRMNETDFVPPCLYVSAHSKYVEQTEKAKGLTKDLFSKCLVSQNCVAKSLLSKIWTSASTIYSRLDKERDTLTPGQLFSSLQQLISAFLIGCFEDDYVSLENQDPFALYAQKPYDAKNIYIDIEAGLSLCAEISAKMNAVCAMTEVQPRVEEPKPTPKPKPTPEPVKPVRKGWEGIEI